MANRSELGWAVVAEYETDSLAVDSDDEKRLERAERTAERKAASIKHKSEVAEKSWKAAPERAKALARWEGVTGTGQAAASSACGP